MLLVYHGTRGSAAVYGMAHSCFSISASWRLSGSTSPKAFPGTYVLNETHMVDLRGAVDLLGPKEKQCVPHRHAEFYSWRRAIIGSTRLARWAGMKQAKSATAKSNITTAKKVSRSVLVIPSSMLFK